MPGVRAVLGPKGRASRCARGPLLTAEPGYAGQPIAVVAADTPEAAGRACVLWRSTSRSGRPIVLDRGTCRAALHRASHARTSAETPTPRSRRPTSRVELTCETPAHVQTPLEPHAAVVSWDGDAAHGVGLDAGHVRRPRGARGGGSGCRKERVRVIARVRRRRLRRQAGRRLRGAARGRARARHRPAGAARANDRHGEQLDGGRRARTRQTVRLGATATARSRRSTRRRWSRWGQGGWRARR